tara:strand:- start:314 stop:9106 length:8793 start_codon:yes stop_codon:yes gene_type:complete
MSNGFTTEDLDYLQDLFNTSKDSILDDSPPQSPDRAVDSFLYPTLSGTPTAAPTESGNLYDFLGSALWHFGSSASMGALDLAEVSSGNTWSTPWAEKNTAQRVGAAIGEATGMFVPMAGFSKVARLGQSAIKGSRAAVREVTKKAGQKVVAEIKDEAIKKQTQQVIIKSARAGAKKDIADVLYKHEFGGEMLEQANRTIKYNIEMSLTSGLTRAGLKVDKKMIKEAVDYIGDGLKDPNKHVNTIHSWALNYFTRKGAPKNLALYAGDVAQDAIVLTGQGMIHNYITSQAKPEEYEYRPWGTLGHSLAMSFAFPLVRAIGGGGERRMGELWQILKREHKRTNYDKLVKSATGPQDLKDLMKIVTGGSYNSILKATKFKGVDGKMYSVNELANMNFNNPKVLKNAVHIMKNIQKSIGKFDQVKMWGKEWGKDFVSLGSMSRMAIGAGVMNVSMFSDNMNALRNLPEEEVLTHLLIGGLMAKGKGGWLMDPARRSSDHQALEIQKTYELMNVLGIDHSDMSQYLSIKGMQDTQVQRHAGLAFDPTAKEIHRIYSEYANKIVFDNTDASSIKGTIIDEYNPLAYLMRMSNSIDDLGAGVSSPDYTKLTPEQNAAMQQELNNIVVGDNSLKNVRYQDFMDTFRVNSAKATGKMYEDYLLSLARDSEEGANDKIINLTVDSQGKIRYGKINYDNLNLDENPDLSVSQLVELDNLLINLKSKGLAEEMTGSAGYGLTDLSSNPKAIKRLENINSRFRDTIKSNAFGTSADKINFYINIGNPEDNTFLADYLNSKEIEGTKRLGDIVASRNLDKMTPEDISFKSAVEEKLMREGFIYAPENYRIVDDKNQSLDIDSNTYEKFHGIVSAFYHGSNKTKRITNNGEQINIREKDVNDIIGSYDSRGFGVNAENLFKDSKFQSLFENRAYENLGLKNEHIRIVKSLEESGLAIVTEEGILLNNDEAIQNLIKDESGLDLGEYTRYANDILNAIGGEGKYIQRPGALEFDFTAGKEPNIESLKKIHKMIPEIYSQEIDKSIGDIIDSGRLKFNHRKYTHDLEQMALFVKKGSYDDARLALENLKNIIDPAIYSQLETGIADAIIDKQLAVKLTQDLAPETGTAYEAINNMISSERMASQSVERKLMEILYGASEQRMDSITNYMSLIDNLSNAYKGNVKKASISELFDSFTASNSYKDLVQLIQGVTQVQVGRNMPGNIDQSHMVDSFERFMHNHKIARNKDKISIANEYGLLDKDNQIRPSVFAMLKNQNFKSVKDLISSENSSYLTKSVDGRTLDENLLYLSWITNSTNDVMIVKVREKLIPNEDGTLSSVLVREWVPAIDNSEFITPSHKRVEDLNNKGVELYFIAKSGIMNSRYEGNISNVENIEKLFNGIGVNLPSDKYITKSIKENGVLEADDAVRAQAMIPEGNIRYIDVSFGRPLAFVENDASIKSLNAEYSKWYNQSIARITGGETTGMLEKGTLENFKQVFNPASVKNISAKIQALYISELNTTSFDKTWSPSAVRAFNGPKGHYGLNMKLLKYIKLGEGGSMKMLPNRTAIESIYNKINAGDIKLPTSRINSIEKILSDLVDYESGKGGLKIGVLDDEYEGGLNTLLIRERVKYDANNQINDPSLKKHVSDRYDDVNNFIGTLDKSAIDGALYIDKDMRNLFLTMLAENDYINGFKGSMAQSGNDVQYIVMGKGLFIYDARHAKRMESKGLRFLAGQSALKSISGLAIDKMPVSGYVSTESNLGKTIKNMTDNNVMYSNLDGIGIKFNGHVTANAAVPHPWAHYQSKDNAVIIRDGYMNLGNTINKVMGFSHNIRDGAITELGNAVDNFKKQTNNVYESSIEDWGMMMLDLGLTTKNPVLREAIMRSWEDKALPTILKPKNSKFANPFVAPDLEASNPLSADLYVKNDRGFGMEKTERAAVRLQLGESTLGYDATQMRVSNIDDLVFSIRVNDVDWLIKYDGKNYKTYTAFQDYDAAGYTLDGALQPFINKLTDKKGMYGGNVPKEVKAIIERLGLTLEGKTQTRLQATGDVLPSLHDVQSYIEKGILGEKGFNDNVIAPFRNKDAATFKNIDKYKLSLVVLNERGPRKSVSDFIPTRLRIRSNAERTSIEDAGTMYKVNPFDIAANLQADHDGDKVRFTFDFQGNKFEFLKQSYRTSSVDENFKVYDAGVRDANIFGTEFNNADGTLAPAGSVLSSEGGSNLSITKKSMINDQRAVGKVIGMQSALQWMYLSGFSVDFGDGNRMDLNKTLDFGAKNLVENGDIFRRFNKVNQSAVDFVSRIEPEIIKNPIDFMMYSNPIEQEYNRQVLNIGKDSKNGVSRDIVSEVVNILRRPASLFNQIYSEQGGKNATSYDLQSFYADIKRFFRSPDEYVLNRLLYKYQNDPNINLNAKMNELIPMFFDSEKREIFPTNFDDFKRKILTKRIKPNRSVIKFAGTVDEQIKSSNSGYVMDAVVKDKMFKAVELDNAWGHYNPKQYERSKFITNEFMEKIHMFRILGITDEQIMDNGDTAFDFGSKNRWVKNAENASLVFDIITSDIANLENKLQYLSGFKNPNTTEIAGVSDRLISAIKSREVLVNLRHKDYLAGQDKGQIKKRVATYRFDQTRFNNDKKDKSIYAITGKLYGDDGTINFKNLKFVNTWNKSSKFTFRKNSEYLVLDNPVIGHRLSREQSLDGYAWHYVSNDVPRDFVENFNRVEQFSLQTSKNIKRVWIDALNKFRENKSQIADIFTYAGLERKLALDKYYNSNKDPALFNDARKVQYNNIDFSSEESSVYYLSKLLLVPDQLQRQFVQGDQELALLKLNERVFKDVFQWLNDNEYQGVARQIIKEYNQNKDYLMGFTNESTLDLQPSSLYMKKWQIDYDKANKPILSLMHGVITPDAEMILKKGYKIKDTVGEKNKEVKGEFNIREVRNSFSNWNEKTIDNKIANCK